MILIALDMHGRATVVDPSPIAQGTDSESIVLLSPFPVRCPVMMGWVMPDGSPVEIPLDDTENSPKTRYWNMTNVVLSEGYDGNVQSVWTFKPTANLTAQYGTALVCFYVQKPVQSEDPLTHTTIQGYKSLTYNPVEVYVTETLNPIPDGDLDPESPLLGQILSAITYYNSYLTDIAENGVSTVFDTLDEEQRKVYTDAVATLGSLHLITSDAVAQVFNEAKDYAATKDTETLNAAKSYTNTQLIPYATKEYADEKATAAGAAAVVSANGYTDTKATQTLNSAESYTDGKVTIINEKIERLEGRVLYATWDTGRWKLPVGCFTTGNHYTLICRIPTADYNTHVTSNAEPPIQCGDTQYTTGYKLVTLRGGRFPLIGTSYFDDLRYYEVEAPGAIMVSPDYHYFVFSGIAYDNPNDLYQVWFLVDKKIAKLSFGTINDYDLIPGSVFKYLSQIVSSNTAAISTNRASITDDRLRIANLENSLYDFVLGKDVEAFPALKNAILPSAITVDNTVYPIADGANGILSSVKGNTKQFNQLVKNGNFESTANWSTSRSTITISNNVCTVVCDTASANGFAILQTGLSLNTSHKYLLTAEFYCSVSSHVLVKATNSGGSASGYDELISISANTWTKNAIVASPLINCDRIYLQRFVGIDATVVGDEFKVRNCMLVDLTAIGLDSITTVAEFTALYPKSYYPYNAGTLYDSVISGVSLTGRNLIPFKDIDFTISGVRFYSQNGNLYLNGYSTSEIPSTSNSIKNNLKFTLQAGTYYFKRYGFPGVGPSIKNFETNAVVREAQGSFTLTKETVVYLAIAVGYHITLNDIELPCCVNSSDPSFNGQYEPYHLSTISLPSAQTLGGVGTAQDEWQVTRNTDDDYYTIKKTVKVKRIELSALTFTESGGVYSATISDIKSGTTNILLSNYTTEATINGTTLEITTSSTPTGNITYELATPVETTITTTATLTEISAIRENGDMISVVGNDNEDYAQPDVSEYVTYEKADLSGGN